MDNTVFLAQLMGPVFVAAGVAAAVNAKPMLKVFDEIMKGFAMRYFLGAIEMTAGMAIILSHNVWSSLAAFLISIMGWGMAIEGALWLIFPKQLSTFAKGFRKQNVVVLAGIIGLVIGLYWIYFGYVMV